MKREILASLAVLVLISGMCFVLADTAQLSVTVGSTAPTVDSVTVADASPTAGTTTQITVTAIISDTNGVSDIDSVAAEFTLGSPANGNNISTMGRGICTDVDFDTIQCIATYDMQFYDVPMTYNITVTATDSDSKSAEGADTFAYSSLVALELDASNIAFGNMTVGQTKELVGDLDMGTSGQATIKNQGNSQIDATIYATDFSGTSDSFDASQAESQFGTLGYMALSNDPGRTETSLNLAYGASQLSDVDFRLTIPGGALPESYTSTVTISAVAG